MSPVQAFFLRWEVTHGRNAFSGCWTMLLLSVPILSFKKRGSKLSLKTYKNQQNMHPNYPTHALTLVTSTSPTITRDKGLFSLMDLFFSTLTKGENV